MHHSKVQDDNQCISPASLYFPLENLDHASDVTLQIPSLEHHRVDRADSLDSTFGHDLVDFDYEPGTWEYECYENDSWPVTGCTSVRSESSENVNASPPDLANPVLELQQGRAQKRKNQNRAAQRKYRDRKLRYLWELNSGIAEMKRRITHLQSENTKLIRGLCELRAENNALQTFKQSTSPNQQGDDDDDSEALDLNVPTTEGMESLCEAFAAMWALIRLNPAVAKGTLSAETVLERLRIAVEAREISRGVEVVR